MAESKIRIRARKGARLADNAALINDFAMRCFCSIGDQDYIHARMAYKASLFSQFQWSSLHCLEKFTKCILLLNRINGKGLKHEISGAITRINESSGFQIPISDQTRAYFEELEYGARFRYLELTRISRGEDLDKLDRAVFEVRPYCRVLSYQIESNGHNIDMFQYELKRISSIKQPILAEENIIQSTLGKILTTPIHPAHEYLTWRNHWFGNSISSVESQRDYVEVENAPLELHPQILDDVNMYVYLPKEVIDHYRSSGLVSIE